MGRSRSLSPSRGLYDGKSTMKAQHPLPPKVSHLPQRLPVPQPSCTLQDLCSEDKQKVAGLLKQVNQHSLGDVITTAYLVTVGIGE